MKKEAGRLRRHRCCASGLDSPVVASGNAWAARIRKGRVIKLRYRLHPNQGLHFNLSLGRIVPLCLQLP
jgi:hypothetical protein